MPQKNNFTRTGYRQKFPAYPTDHLNIHQNATKVTKNQKNNNDVPIDITQNFGQKVSESLRHSNFTPIGNTGNSTPTIHSMDDEAQFRATNQSQEEFQHQQKSAITNFDPQESSTSTVSVSKNSFNPLIQCPENLSQALPEQDTMATANSSCQNVPTAIPIMHAKNSQKITITYSSYETSDKNSNNSAANGDTNTNIVSNESAFQGLSNCPKTNLVSATEVEKINKNIQKPPSECYVENYISPENVSQSQPTVSVFPQPISTSPEATENEGHCSLRDNDTIQGSNVVSESLSTVTSNNADDSNKALDLYKQKCFDYNRGGYVPPEVRNQIAANAERELGQQTLNENSSINKQNEVTESFCKNNPQPTFSEKLRGNLASTHRTRKIIWMKVIPPFRKEHFMYSQLLEDDVQKAINEIASIFQPKHRGLITISRTNIPQQNGRRLQILMVTAPGEAEGEVARAKLNGIKIMGKTVFPTGDEFWRFSPGEFPKKAMIHITNLPVLCETDELEEMLGLPDHTEHDIMQRESIQTDSGKIYTGRARIPIVINSKEHEEHLLEWSNWRNSEDGLLVWNEIPVYMSIPKLHKCGECEKEGRPYIGHDEKWCRIRRPQQIPTVDHQEPDPIQSHSVQEEDTIPEQEVSNPPQQNEDIHVPMNTENFLAEEVKDSSDDENQPTSSEDDRVDENLDGNAEEPNKWQQTNHNKKRKRKKKSKTSNDSMSSSTKQPNKKPLNVSNG